MVRRELAQPPQRLTESKLHHMPVRIAHGRKVPDDATDISWRLNQNILCPRQLRDPINFLARVALKSEVIEPGLHFVLHDYEHENRICVCWRRRPEPDIVSAFEPPIANYRKTAKRSVEFDRGVDVCAINRDVCPAHRQVPCPRSTTLWLKDDLSRESFAQYFANLQPFFIALHLFLVVANYSLRDGVRLVLVGFHCGQALVLGHEH